MNLGGSASLAFSRCSRQLLVGRNSSVFTLRTVQRLPSTYSGGPRRSYAWSRSPDNTRNSRLGSSTSIAKQAQRAQRRTSQDTTGSSEPADEVYGRALYDHETTIIPGADSTAEEGLKRLLETDTIVVVRYAPRLSATHSLSSAFEISSCGGTDQDTCFLLFTVK